VKPLKNNESDKEKVSQKKSKAIKKAAVKTPKREKTIPERSNNKNTKSGAKDSVIHSEKTDKKEISKSVKTEKNITAKKKENPADKFYKLLTDEDKEEKEVEEIDPAALARGDEPMSIVSHLDELRSRVLVILVAFMVITAIAFYFSDILIYYVNKPFLDSGNKLNIFTLVGGFMLKFKVSAATAIFILVPLIIFQIWRFIVPAIERKNRTFSRLTIISAVLLFYSGVSFVFFILLPAAIKVMLSFVGPEMISTIGADDYLNFIVFSSLIMGVLFEVPVIILVLTRLGIVSPQFLISKRKYAILIIWIIAAIVTPQPDPLSQSLVGVPLMLLYEISIIISKIVAIRERKKINS